MKKVIMGMLAIVTLTACSGSEDGVKIPDLKTGMAINFGSGIGDLSGTRVIAEGATAFAAGDAIEVIGYSGISETPAAYGTPFMAEPFKADATGKFSLDVTSPTYNDQAEGVGEDPNKGWPEAYKWNEDNNSYYFFAYYPKADGTLVKRAGANITLPVITSPSEGLEDEILWAKSDKVTYAERMNTPSLMFKRKLSKVRFRIQFPKTEDMPAGVDPADYELQNISFKADKQLAEMNLLTGALSLGTKEVTYTLEADATGAIEDNKAVVNKNATDYNSLGFAPMFYGNTTVELSDLKVKINNEVIPVTFATAGAFKVEEGKITYVILTFTPSPAGEFIEFDSSIEAWRTVDGGEGSL